MRREEHRVRCRCEPLTLTSATAVGATAAACLPPSRVFVPGTPRRRSRARRAWCGAVSAVTPAAKRVALGWPPALPCGFLSRQFLTDTCVLSRLAVTHGKHGCLAPRKDSVVHSRDSDGYNNKVIKSPSLHLTQRHTFRWARRALLRAGPGRV